MAQPGWQQWHLKKENMAIAIMTLHNSVKLLKITASFIEMGELCGICITSKSIKEASDAYKIMNKYVRGNGFV